jgi:hypothetical protein
VLDLAGSGGRDTESGKWASGRALGRTMAAAIWMAKMLYKIVLVNCGELGHDAWICDVSW